jgi:hypothetical protein
MPLYRHKRAINALSDQVFVWSDAMRGLLHNLQQVGPRTALADWPGHAESPVSALMNRR